VTRKWGKNFKGSILSPTKLIALGVVAGKKAEMNWLFHDAFSKLAQTKRTCQ
jgi:hypothetical protein